MNKQIKIAFAFAAVVALAMGLLVGLASKENEDVAAALTTQRTSSASAASGYMVSSTGGYTTYDESDGGGKSGKGAATHTVGYTIEDCELYYLQSSGKSGKGRRRNLRRDLSSKGSKSGGEGIDVYCATHSHAMMSMQLSGGGGFIGYFETSSSGGKGGKGGSGTYSTGGKASQGSHVDVVDVAHSGDWEGDIDIEYVETSSGGKGGKGGSGTYSTSGGKASKGGTYAYTATSHVDVVDVAHSGDWEGDIDIKYVETSSGGKGGKGGSGTYSTSGGKASKGGTYAYTATSHVDVVDVDHTVGHWEGGSDHGGQYEEIVPAATNPNWN